MASFEKDNVYNLLKNLTSEIQSCIKEMKADFEANPPQSNVKERFMIWKSKYSDIVNQNLKQYIFQGQEKDPNFDFRDFLQKINEEYQNENEFLELLKSVNKEIEILKEFIRGHLQKDPSIYYVKEL